MLLLGKKFIPCVRSKNVYKFKSYFDECRISAYWNCGLSYHSTAARVGRDYMNVCRICNWSIHVCCIEGSAHSQWLTMINSRKDRHLTHKTTENSWSMAAGWLARSIHQSLQSMNYGTLLKLTGYTLYIPHNLSTTQYSGI